MSKHPFKFRKALLAIVALSSTALAACIAEVPARPGVDYGYVGGTYSTAPTPYEASPYDGPYSDPYYDSYYGYNSPYYGGPYYSGGYYGPSTTYIYTRDRYSPGYGYRSRGNSYRDDRSPNSNNHDSRDHDWRDHNGNDGSRGDGDHQGGGNWNHDRPSRPDGHPAPGNSSQHQNDHPRPVMGNGRPLLGGALNGNNRTERRDPPPVAPAAAAPAKPDRRHSFRDQRARD